MYNTYTKSTTHVPQVESPKQKYISNSNAVLMEITMIHGNHGTSSKYQWYMQPLIHPKSNGSMYHDTSEINDYNGVIKALGEESWDRSHCQTSESVFPALHLGRKNSTNKTDTITDHHLSSFIPAFIVYMYIYIYIYIYICTYYHCCFSYYSILILL